jgi:poly(A) polymerase
VSSSRRAAVPLDELVTLAGSAWLVGGAIRDELLGRASLDFDVVVAGDSRALARELARRVRAHTFALSEAFGAWRVLARDQTWRIDLTPLAGATIVDDLARRDLSINAIARPLQGGELIDPYGGRDDLAARRLRQVGPDAFAADPLRVLRLARLRAELDFAIEPETVVLATASAPALASVAAERAFAELGQIVCGPRPLAGLSAMEELGASAALLPELLALRGVQQSDFHHLDVYGHTIAVLESLVELERDPSSVFGDCGAELAAVLSEPLANELTRGQALRFGALLHDIAKAQTRAVTPEGRVTFMGHDRAGAKLAAEMLTRLRASERLAMHVAALTRDHLRLGFLVHEMPLDRRALYRYLRACEPVEVDVTVLSVADRLATLGRNSGRAVELHLELAREVLPEALRWHAQPPRPPVRGDALADALGLEPGPLIGRLLAELTESTFAGEVADPGEAVAVARQLLASDRLDGAAQ